MLKHLSIQNYALIESAEIDFEPTFSVITGETGAGKSILLGALSLILGNRADTNILKNKELKCVVEAQFDIQRYSLKLFFDNNEIDYDDITVIRREIAPNGRSRAFVNDTPVTLNVIKDLSEQLIDIHSQHQNINLNDNKYQLTILDAYGKLIPIVESYNENYRKYTELKKEYQKLTEREKKQKENFDFLQFQFEELYNAKLISGEIEQLQDELKQINHSEEILQNLNSAYEVINNEETGILEHLRQSIAALKQIQSYYSKSTALAERLESSKIEIDDISSELDVLVKSIEFDPERALFLKERIDLIYFLINKHRVETVDDLIKLKENLQMQLDEISSFDFQINAAAKELSIQEEIIKQLSEQISEKRISASFEFQDEIINILKKLGIPSAAFKVKHILLNDYTETGKDSISFLFSANKHIDVQDITQIASGGEISRLMLSIKAIIADSMALPTIIFDEIDTGVSGEIADKIGSIMKEMSQNLQVISITHLPQVASNAYFHYKVYKKENEFKTLTEIKKLDKNERISELATMLSGENITEAAIKNAEELLKKI